MKQVTRALYALAAALVFSCGAWPDEGMADADFLAPSDTPILDPVPMPPADAVWFDNPNMYGMVELDDVTEKSPHGVVGIGFELFPKASGCTNGVACQALDPAMTSWNDVFTGSLTGNMCGESVNQYNPCIVPDTITKVRTWKLNSASCGNQDNDGALIVQAALNAIARWNTELQSTGWRLEQAFGSTVEDFTLFCEDVGMGSGVGQAVGHAWPYSENTPPTVRSLTTAVSHCSATPNQNYHYDTAWWYKTKGAAIALSRTFLINYIGANCSYTLPQRDNFILQSAETIWMHEIGHGLGLNHFGLDNGANIMQPGFTCANVNDWSNAVDGRILNALKGFNSADTGVRNLVTADQECLLPGAVDVTDGT